VQPLHWAMGWFCAAIAAGPGVGSAEGQATQYQSYPVGEEALGMGGAFTGVADSPAATFYNPGGLAGLQKTLVSGSLSVNSLDRFELNEGFESAGRTFDLSHDAFPSVPVFVGFVVKLGEKTAEGVRRHALAISTVQPVSQQRHFQVRAVDDAGRLQASLRTSQSDRATWYGASYALTVVPDVSVGASMYLSFRKIRHTEQQLELSYGARGPDGNYTGATQRVRDVEAQVDARQLVFRLGALWDVNGRWNLGLMLQLPSIRLRAPAKVIRASAFTDHTGSRGSTRVGFVDQRGLTGAAPFPFELRLGAEYEITSRERLALDMSLYGPLGDADDPVEPFGPVRTRADGGSIGLYVPRQWHARPIANVSLGGETTFFEAVPLRAGFFTNLSSAAPIDRGTSEYQPPRVHEYGFTVSAGYRRNGYDVSVGMGALFGRGTGLRLDPARPEGKIRYVPTGAKSRSLHFFISGAASTAGRIVKRVVEPDAQDGSEDD
jgi:hypothetical protein